MLLNKNVLPRLWNVTVKCSQLADLHKSPSPVARDACLSHDTKVLESLDLMAKEDSTGDFEVHLYGIDEQCLELLEKYPNLQKVLHTLWFHDERDIAGLSTNHLSIDFGKSMTEMINLRDLNITFDSPTTANFTTFLPLLGSCSKLEKLNVSIQEEPVFPAPGGVEWNRHQPIIPSSVTELSCTTTFLDVLRKFDSFQEPTFDNVKKLSIFIETSTHSVSLQLPFRRLVSLEINLCDPGDAQFRYYEELVELTGKNRATLEKLSLFMLPFHFIPDLFEANPDLKELHIGHLSTNRLPVFSVSLDLLSHFSKLQHLTIGLERIHQLTSQTLGDLLTQKPFKAGYPEQFGESIRLHKNPSSMLETVTIKFPTLPRISKMPKLLMDLPTLNIENYDISTHSTFYEASNMFDVPPSVDCNQKPNYLWQSLYSTATYVVFDVKEIAKNLYPELCGEKSPEKVPFIETTIDVESF